jgi:CheY-like chemotaxis protein
MYTVLVIDDDEGILTLVRLVLERASYNALAAASGADGLRLAQTRLPDLILLDDTLPVISSGEVGQQLRRNPLTSHIPIIIFSAGMESYNPAYIHRLGGDGMLPKPFRQADLLALLDQHLPG